MHRQAPALRAESLASLAASKEGLEQLNRNQATHEAIRTNDGADMRLASLVIPVNCAEDALRECYSRCANGGGFVYPG